MGRVRDWQDGNGQRGLVLEALDMKTIESGLAQHRGPNGITTNDTFLVYALGSTTSLSTIY